MSISYAASSASVSWSCSSKCSTRCSSTSLGLFMPAKPGYPSDTALFHRSAIFSVTTLPWRSVSSPEAPAVSWGFFVVRHLRYLSP